MAQDPKFELKGVFTFEKLSFKEKKIENLYKILYDKGNFIAEMDNMIIVKVYSDKDTTTKTIYCSHHKEIKRFMESVETVVNDSFVKTYGKVDKKFSPCSEKLRFKSYKAKNTNKTNASKYTRKLTVHLKQIWETYDMYGTTWEIIDID